MGRIDSDLKRITSEPWLVWQCWWATFSARAKWRSFMSAGGSVGKKYLTGSGLVRDAIYRWRPAMFARQRLQMQPLRIMTYTLAPSQKLLRVWRGRSRQPPMSILLQALSVLRIVFAPIAVESWVTCGPRRLTFPPRAGAPAWPRCGDDRWRWPTRRRRQMTREPPPDSAAA